MRFGAMNFPVRPVLEELDAIASLGLDFFELTMDPPQAHFSQVYRQREDILGALKATGLGLVCHMPTFIHTADLAEGIRRASVQEVIRSLETAAELGAKKAVLHPGYVWGMASHVMDQVRKLAMESLAVIAQKADQLGITVCVENMMPGVSPYVKPEDFDAVFKAFPQLQLTLDTGHAHMGDKSGRRIVGFVDRYGDRLAHVHISDNHGVRDDHLPVGHGSIDFKAVMRALRRAGYNESMTMEIFVPDRSMLVASREKIISMLQA